MHSMNCEVSSKRRNAAIFYNRNYRTWHDDFSRNGLEFFPWKPVKRQSSGALSRMYLYSSLLCLYQEGGNLEYWREVEVVVVVLIDLDEVTRPSLFTERIGLFAGKSHNQVVLHHVIHCVALDVLNGLRDWNPLHGGLAT